MLEILTILVALSSTHSAPINPLVGLWENATEDSFEFRSGGIGHDYVKVIGSGLEYRWEQIGNQIKFDYPEDIPDRTCLFTINKNVLILSQCKIITSELEYVESWAGERIK